MKRTTYYILSGILLGVATDFPLGLLFMSCGLGGGCPNVVNLATLIMLWLSPIIGGVIGFFIAHRNPQGTPSSDMEQKIGEGVIAEHDRKPKKVLFFSSLPVIIILAWYVFGTILSIIIFLAWYLFVMRKTK
ncbi:MAG: hypothetical protein AAB391_02805 [Patescibacteria group bacterium]|mgnify:CR=1 FL=1